MDDVKGFYVHVGTGYEYLTIENTDKSGHVTIIESNGLKKFDLANEKFIELANFLKHEADLIQKQMKAAEPEVNLTCGEMPIEKEKPKQVKNSGKRKAV